MRQRIDARSNAVFVIMRSSDMTAERCEHCIEKQTNKDGTGRLVQLRNNAIDVGIGECLLVR
jgi:hypothetical protein